MRFDELLIEKYGVYETLTLPLAGRPGLVIIYGANEAGKSTCLSAIADFLFGVGHSSSHGQVFGNDQMRITATLRRANGEQLTLRRRKGRGVAKTLADRDGKIVAETVLSTLLGTLDRVKFGSLFGLNHESLREGGRRLLAAEGDIGRLIVEAGGGLRTLVEKLAVLDGEADKLFANRRAADRQFYQQLDAFELAETKVKNSLVTRESYELARQQHEAAKSAAAQLKHGKQLLSQQRGQTQRLVRVIPLLDELDKLDQRLQSFADLPPLPSGFAQTVRDALLAHQLAHKDATEAQQEREKLHLQIESLHVPAELLAAEGLVRDLGHKAAEVSSARAARPQLEKELADSERQLWVLKQSVGAAPDADLAPLIPAAEAIERMQRLATDGLLLQPQIHSLQTRIAEDSDTLDTLTQRHRQRAQAGQDAPLGITASQFASLPEKVRTLAARRDQGRRAEQELARRLQEAGFPSVDALRDFTAPDAAVIQAELQRRALLDAELLHQGTALRTHTARRDAAEGEIERLRQGGPVPTDRAIATARQARDLAWAPIRTVYLAADAQTILAQSLSQRTEAVVWLERWISEADDLATRKSSEAQRVAALELLEKQRAESIAALAAAHQSAAALEAILAESRRAWVAQWAAAAALEPDLGRLKERVERRRELLGQVSAVELLRAECDPLAAEVESRLELLALAEQHVGLPAAPSASLTARIQSVTQRITVHEEAYRSFREDATAISSTESQLKKRRTQLAALHQTESVWLNKWQLAAQQIGLAADVSPKRATEVATQWAAASGIVHGITLLRRRLAQLSRDELELRDLLTQIATQLDFGLPADSVAAARMVEDRWQAASRLQTQHTALLPQLVLRTRSRDAKQQALLAAEQQLAALASQAQSAVADLLAIAERQEARVAAQSAQHQLQDKIVSAGDGQAVADWRTQVSRRDLLELSAELGQLEKEEVRLDAELDHASADVQACQHDLVRFQTAEGSNSAVAERERAAAELHQIVDRYIEVALAKALLAAGIEQIRSEQQDPLIRRVGELFALTTGGAFTKVETEVDAKGNPVIVGRRGPSAAVPIELMSDGTRDQLFLAFRLAHIEQYCRTTEPLPFVADDLLAHFDDARSLATLQLLAELGKSTQVLLFTHHRSIRDAGVAAADRGVASVIDLAAY